MALYLLDTNILLRSSDAMAAEHDLAVEATANLLGRGDTLFVAPQNVIEFWAVVTRPLPANGFGWTAQQAQSEIDQYLNQFPLLSDTADIFTQWLDLVTTLNINGKQVHDARLVAVMLSHSVTHLLTFNSVDFQRYTNIIAVHPQSVT